VSKVTLYPLWDTAVGKAAQPAVRKAGTSLLGDLRSAWAGVSNGVRVSSNVLDVGYAIHIGTSRASHRYAHLIEFGGGRHSAKAPTRRVAEANGVKIKWKSDG
jgi:hypothetical protein